MPRRFFRKFALKRDRFQGQWFLAPFNHMLHDRQLSLPLHRDATITAETAVEVEPLLTAAFRDWVDFVFTPSPKPFVIYADHDEYATFFASSRANLNSVASPLIDRGFRAVEDYTRKD